MSYIFFFKSLYCGRGNLKSVLQDMIAQERKKDVLMENAHEYCNSGSKGTTDVQNLLV